jgi:hypothetical protein
MARVIHMPNGMSAIVDDEDYDRLSGYSWYANTDRRRRVTYAYRKAGGRRGRSVAMHREVAQPPPGLEVDHINGNGLDNRRSNLRLVTRQQNSMNRGLNRNNTTGYKGVTRPMGSRSYIASVKFNYRRIYLGSFPTAESAARAYDAAARRYHGEHAYTNFPGA